MSKHNFKLGNVAIVITLILLLILVGPYMVTQSAVGAQVSSGQTSASFTIFDISEPNAILIFLIVIFAVLSVILKLKGK